MVKNLRKLRKARGLSQQKLAALFGLSQQSIYKYEKGLADPDVDMLINFANYFYTTIDYLVGIVDDDNIQSAEPLTTREIQHVKMYRRLSRATQYNIDSLIENILDKK